MAPSKKQIKNIISEEIAKKSKPKTASNIHKMKKNTDDGILEKSDEEDHIYNEAETDSEIEGETPENIEELEEKEVENEDLFGDDNNEIDDEDKGLSEESESDAGEGIEEGEEGEAKVEDEEGCLYKFAVKNKQLDSDDEFEEETEIYDDDTKIYNMVVNKEERITKPVLFMYERVRILGTRARQLSRGAKPMLLNVEHLSPKEIARLEMENKVVPFIIVRTLPNGKKEHWHLNELTIVN